MIVTYRAVIGIILAFVIVAGATMAQPLLPGCRPGFEANHAAPAQARRALQFLPMICLARPTPAATAPTSAPPVATTVPTPPVDVRESFEDPRESWRVGRVEQGNGRVSRSTTVAAEGSASAQLTTAGRGARAYLWTAFSGPATQHQWEERPGTWHWQRASLYLPAATVAGLGPDDHLTLAGVWPSAGGPYGWSLQVRQGGQLWAAGYTHEGKPVAFQLYGVAPTERWVELELGLHTQAGPGVKRAFAVVIDGDFYGWFRQGNMRDETYDRAAIGIIETSSAAPLTVHIDQWREATTDRLPSGPDRRVAAKRLDHDFRTQQGANIQYDWSTWEYAPTLDARAGLYSARNRIQAGSNLDRMPDLSNGWAEIEIDWSRGAPPNLQPEGYFGPMVGFRKEINREENLEVIPIGRGGGRVNLALEAWIGNPVILAEWPLPLASIGNTHIPEPGDIIRVRWEQASATELHIQASYYDASADRWFHDIIDGRFDLSNVADNDAATDNVNYLDGYHTASSITIDSPDYAIRRYTVGTLATYP